MNFRWIILLIVATFGLRAHAQGPYRITQADIPVAIGAGALAGASVWVQSRVQPFSPADLALLDPNQIPVFDRLNVGDWRPGAKRASDIAVLVACASPLTLFAGQAERHDFAKLLLMGSEAGLTSFGLVGMAKGLVHRARPFDYGTAAPLSEQLKRDARFSFFSGHTCFTATATFFGAQVYSDYHPDSKWKALVWAGAAAIPAGVGYLRMRAGKHFLSDVAAGYAVGAASGILVPLLHRSKRADGLSLQPMFWGNGSGVAMTWRW